MTRESFAGHMKDLEKDVLGMGQMVITAVHKSVDALKGRNLEDAKKIVADDVHINKRRWEIEEKCINLIALQQPVATDLREIIAVLNIITDLERMGDYAEGIAKIVIMLGGEPLIKPLVDIPRMCEKAVSMLQRSLEAFTRRDAAVAKAICNEDDEVDLLYEQVYRELLTYMIEDPKTIRKATPLIWAAHNLERIADRVTNICERTVFLAGGTMQEVKVSTY
jgi:phosphate transport system protein